MTEGFDIERDFQRYLAAKRTVDDRAIDRRTLHRLRANLRGLETITILEVGCGTGAMIERLLGLPALPDYVEYTGVDTDPANVETARSRLPDRLAEAGYDCEHTDGRIRFHRSARTVSLDLVVDDAVAYVEDQRAHDREWDVLVGHAVLDVIGLDALADLLSAVPGGLCYFPITFDGGTRFTPPLPLDTEIETRFHEYLDAKPEGSSRAGRETLARLRASGGEILAAGGSDWVVYPHDGGYPADEAYFLHYIVDTIVGALSDDHSIDDAALREWRRTRHSQVENGDLTYVAHQLDLLARAPSPSD